VSDFPLTEESVPHFGCFVKFIYLTDMINKTYIEA